VPIKSVINKCCVDEGHTFGLYVDATGLGSLTLAQQANLVTSKATWIYNLFGVTPKYLFLYAGYPNSTTNNFYRSLGYLLLSARYAFFNNALCTDGVADALPMLQRVNNSVYSNYQTNTKNNGIYLFNDNCDTYRGLNLTLAELLPRGFNFVNSTNCLNIPEYLPSPRAF
jgi:hypothetical protein